VLAEYGIPLLYHEGSLDHLIAELKKQIEITDVFWNDAGQNWQRQIPQGTQFVPNLLFPPAALDRTFKKFTPYWNYCLKQTAPSEPLPKPRFKQVHASKISLSHGSLILPSDDASRWQGVADFWTVGESAARTRWKNFLDGALSHYEKGRDEPGVDHTSRLSPYLHFGQISVRQIWHDLTKRQGSTAKTKFLSELGWREFSYHLLYHNPTLPTKPLQHKFEYFEWEPDRTLLHAWQEGKTGFPLVDAGMRQLKTIGWMHNRVRMVVASFLTKNLLIPWQLGARWFLDFLVDADVANNSASWQWVAGCGADAAPFFRIFNPVLQSKKFDPRGVYIRQWVPELADMDKKYIHTPWLAQSVALHARYPRSIISLEASRNRALSAFKRLPKAI
jgi:deoxyribodipyrimidine photo-lyase